MVLANPSPPSSWSLRTVNPSLLLFQFASYDDGHMTLSFYTMLHGSPLPTEHCPGISASLQRVYKRALISFYFIPWPGFNPNIHFMTPRAQTLFLVSLQASPSSLPVRAGCGVSVHTCFPWVCSTKQVSQVFPPLGFPGGICVYHATS